MSRPTNQEPWVVQRPPSPLDSRDGVTTSPGSELGDLHHGVDVREEIGDILDNHGHIVFLRRALDRHCGCWREDTREADLRCPYCTGTGWLYQDERYLTRRMPLTDPVVAALLESRSPVGFLGVAEFLFWFKHDVKPTKRDVILEVTLDEETGQPVEAINIEKIWSIGQVQDFRDRYGRVEYWGCWVRDGQLGKE